MRLRAFDSHEYQCKYFDDSLFIFYFGTHFHCPLDDSLVLDVLVVPADAADYHLFDLSQLGQSFLLAELSDMGGDRYLLLICFYFSVVFGYVSDKFF